MGNKNWHSSIIGEEKNGVLFSPINLLNSIKSKYILGKIVSILDVKIKLNLFIFNKKFKNKLGIILDDYKKKVEKNLLVKETGKEKYMN